MQNRGKILRVEINILYLFGFGRLPCLDYSIVVCSDKQSADSHTDGLVEMEMQSLVG
jgi:hypothetical protein